MLFSYTVTFEEALTAAATAKPEERQAKMAALLRRSDIRDAHPTFDHILPTYIAAGAAGSDLGEKLWDLPEGSLNWAQYRFGKITS
jgi:aromatic ring-opening dioxygenase catalytic subunit (LigB family)